MIIGPHDLGAPSHPWMKPAPGMTIGTVVSEGYETLPYPRSVTLRKQIVTFWAKAWQAVGGQAANSQSAAKYFLKQVEELASNRDYSPTYIQFMATADPGALLNTTDPHDGWYIIDSFEPDYQNFVVAALVKCRMTVSWVASQAPRRFALYYTGGALSSNFSGAATNLLSLPIGSIPLEATFNRTGAEGAIPCIPAPLASPEPTVLSTTLGNYWKGGVHVYDTINTTSNPVPTTGGTFVNTNWVEVFGTDHDFVGDCVLTNGLNLLLFQATTQFVTCYLWNTALAVANWQQYGSITNYDNASNPSTWRSYSLVRVGPEECALAASATTPAGGQAFTLTFRLQRGRYECRVDFRTLTQAYTNSLAFIVNTIAAPKIAYNSGRIGDLTLSEASPTVQTDYGYGAGFIPNTSYPFIIGILYQNQPGGSQPFIGGNFSYLGIGDTASLAINAQRSYGFFAIPYGVSGTYSTANLQQEMETASIVAPMVTATDAGASGGSAARLPSGSSSGSTIQTFWTPAAGTYDVWARMRVVSMVSTSIQMRVGLFDQTSGWVAGQFTDYAPSSLAITYAWYRVATNVAPIAGHLQALEATFQTTTTTTDWFIDEMALVPRQITQGTTLAGGPQDIYQQFRYDRGVRWTRP